MPALTVDELIEQRQARELSQTRLDDELRLRHQEDLSAFKQRLDAFQLADWHVPLICNHIKHAFERGDIELMFTSFPSSFCTDGGRAINNVGEPPINAPTDAAMHDPVWLATLPAGVRTIYAYWKDNLQAGGFGFAARIIDYPGGMPGDVGLFLTWPRSAVAK